MSRGFIYGFISIGVYDPVPPRFLREYFAPRLCVPPMVEANRGYLRDLTYLYILCCCLGPLIRRFGYCEMPSCNGSVIPSMRGGAF